MFSRFLTVLLLCVVTLLAGCSFLRTASLPADLLVEDRFTAINGWENDDLREAWPAFLASCEKLKKQVTWKTPCGAAHLVDASDTTAIRTFFESYFIPYRALSSDSPEENPTDAGLMTGYYEPLLRGSRQRGGAFQTPLYAKPDDLLSVDLSSTHPELKGTRMRGKRVGNQIIPYPSRAEITSSDTFNGKVLLWVDDPVEAFFLQVQGSGRVQLAETQETVRLAYAEQNGHPYKSIGRYLADRGEIPLEQASAQRIKEWLVKNPGRKDELLNANPSYIFFREEKISNPAQGPKGAMGIPLSAGRSVAVDPSFIPLGAPVFIASTHPASNMPLQRLTLAQDTGSAIKGSARVDYFWGFGTEAGEVAGKTKQRVTLWVLRPKSSVATQTIR
ncbi:MAG: murein transglycosylase [Oxalobacter sp.]|nr:MAG: murein transglycosylase [Oxalobacter sp.]